MRVGKPGVKRTHRHLDREAERERKEQQHLHRAHRHDRTDRLHVEMLKVPVPFCAAACIVLATIAAALAFPASKSIVACVTLAVSAVSCVRKYILITPSSMTTEPTSVYRKNLIAA